MSKQLPDAVGDNENYGPRAAGCDERSKILRDSRVYRAWQSSPRLGADLKVAFFGGSKADCDWVKTVAPGCEVDILERDDSVTPRPRFAKRQILRYLTRVFGQTGRFLGVSGETMPANDGFNVIQTNPVSPLF